MPVVDNTDHKKRNWPLIIGGGCCGCLVLAVAIYAVVVMIVLAPAVREIYADIGNSSPSPAPSGTVSAYRFSGRANAATCVVPLPHSSNALQYMHVLGTGKTPGAGERAVRLMSSGRTFKERPLLYYPSAKIRVGLYYRAGKAGNPSYVRLYDGTGESAIDLNSGNTICLTRSRGHVYSNDCADWIDSSNYNSNYRTTTPSSHPAGDVTATFGKDKGQYIGSIVQSGKKLVFVPAKGKP
jgi:hypothetical protein